MSSTDEAARLRALLGVEPAGWIRERLRRAYERDGRFPRRLTKQHADPDERDWVDRLFGRRPTEGVALSIDVERLETVLVGGGLCEDLVAALERLDGPLRDRKGEHEAREHAWAVVLATTEARVAGRPWLERWLAELIESGQHKRLSGADPRVSRAQLAAALDLADRFPLAGVALPELAAQHAGDAHALDKGRPLGLLCVRAAAAFGELDDWSTPDGRRESWAAVGVICDELSAPVLTLGLPASGSSLTDRVLRAHRDLGEPCLLGLRQLVRHPPDLSWAEGRDVFVCENPTVVAAAAARLGASSAPLVCTSGHLRAATRVLCRSLARAGARLRVRGDFDVDGLHIAAKTLALPRATPWRMDAETYRSATAGPPLRSNATDAPWDPALGAAMRERGVAVHEEVLLDELLADLEVTLARPRND